MQHEKRQKCACSPAHSAAPRGYAASASGMGAALAATRAGETLRVVPKAAPARVGDGILSAWNAPGMLTRRRVLGVVRAEDDSRRRAGRFRMARRAHHLRGGMGADRRRRRVDQTRGNSFEPLVVVGGRDMDSGAPGRRVRALQARIRPVGRPG